jgi:hypothetical protein
LQTFLISKIPSETAEILDRQRLGKQRVEAVQILNVLTGKSEGWKNHPAVRMWVGHERFLLDEYLCAMIDEWAKRGYKNTKVNQHRIVLAWDLRNHHQTLQPPPWFSDELFLSHKSNLLRKNAQFYRPIFGPDIPDNLPYIWPV